MFIKTVCEVDVTSGKVQSALFHGLGYLDRFDTSGLHARHREGRGLGLDRLAFIKAAEDWGGWVAVVVLFFDGFGNHDILFLEMASSCEKTSAVIRQARLYEQSLPQSLRVIGQR